MRHVKALTMGSTKLWLPSRRSVDSHRGGLSIVLLGHDLSGRFSGWNFLYFFEGSASIGILALVMRLFFSRRNSAVAARRLVQLREYRKGTCAQDVREEEGRINGARVRQTTSMIHSKKSGAR